MKALRWVVAWWRAWWSRWFRRPLTVAPVPDLAPVMEAPMLSMVDPVADDPFTPTLARSPFGYRYRRTAAYKDW